MKKEAIKKIKKSIWLSHGFIILVCAIIIWLVLFYLFSNTSVLKDFARVINDGTASSAKITWGIFWVIMPIITLIQFIGLNISLAGVEEKKKDKVVKGKRKKK